MSQSSLSQLLNGSTPLDRLQEIASIIGVSVSELVADENDASNTITCPHCGKRIYFDGELPQVLHKNIRGREYYKKSLEE